MGIDFYTSNILPHAGIIIKICRAYTNTPEDFEDYYQEVCLQIWRSRKRFKQQSSWTTWIYKIALNVCLTYLKRQKNTSVTFTSDPLPEQVIEDSKRNLSQDLKALYRAIQELDEIDRAIILLYLEKQSHQKIGEILGITSNNVGVRVLRIKKQLQQKFDDTEKHHE